MKSLACIKNINKQIFRFITKYPFVTDPIVLFNPEEIPKSDKILNLELDLNYKLIEENIKIIDSIKNELYDIVKLIHKERFNNLYLKIEYLERIKDFYKVIRIIEIFHEKEEYEKYNLINEYFWIDFELLEEIFLNKEILEKEFRCKKKFLKDSTLSKLEATFIDSKWIKNYFEKALEFLWLENIWKVKIWDVISIVHTNFNEIWWDLVIPKDYNINIKRLLILISHEIDWHCTQFSNCDSLSSWWIRYSKSESLVEWFAMYNEYLFQSKMFWENWINNLVNNNKERFKLSEWEISISEFYKSYNWNLFRNFRWFKNIDKYFNLKDFVYLQWIYKVIKYSKTYNNFLEIIRNWAINDSYIKKYWQKEWRKEKIKIKETSAFFILNEILENVIQ